MKHIYIILILFGISVQAKAQDSTAYTLQRKKVNDLLDQRNAKFGQYEQSLASKTGIFGLKTKKDMQKSIDILSEIVITDNHVFKELKILMDYKDMEKTVSDTRVTESGERINNYMMTIARLQKQNEELIRESKELEKSIRIETAFIVLLTIAIITLFFFFIRLINRVKTLR